MMPPSIGSGLSGGSNGFESRVQVTSEPPKENVSICMVGCTHMRSFREKRLGASGKWVHNI